MSAPERSFLKWFGTIAAAALIGFGTFTFTVIGSVDVLAERVNQNAKEVEEVRMYHKRDVDDIKDYMKTFAKGQEIMQEDIKKLLQK